MAAKAIQVTGNKNLRLSDNFWPSAHFLKNGNLLSELPLKWDHQLLHYFQGRKRNKLKKHVERFECIVATKFTYFLRPTKISLTKNMQAEGETQTLHVVCFFLIRWKTLYDPSRGQRQGVLSRSGWFDPSRHERVKVNPRDESFHYFRPTLPLW